MNTILLKWIEIKKKLKYRVNYLKIYNKFNQITRQNKMSLLKIKFKIKMRFNNMRQTLLIIK